MAQSTTPAPAAKVYSEFDPSPEAVAARGKVIRRLARSRGHRQLEEIDAVAGELVGLLGDFLREHDHRGKSFRGCGCHFCRWLSGQKYPGPEDFFNEMIALHCNLQAGVAATVGNLPNMV